MNEVLVNGNVVNEFDEVVGKFYHIANNLYRLTIYGNSNVMTAKQMKDKVYGLQLYFEPVWG